MIANKLVIFLFLALFIAACTSNNAGQYQGRSQNRFGNLTDEQRQQRMQAMADACKGKSENESCTAQTQFGEREGICRTRNATLICFTQRQRQNSNQ